MKIDLTFLHLPAKKQSPVQSQLKIVIGSGQSRSEMVAPAKGLDKRSSLPVSKPERRGIKDLTYEQISEIFYLDDNVIRWTQGCGGINGRKFKAGSIAAGCRSSQGYYYMTFTHRGLKYQPKRTWILWILAYGRWPSGVIDHIDGNPSNDCFDNLRDVPQYINLRNNPAQRSGKIIGVGYDKRYRLPWRVSFSINNKTKIFGRYATREEAVERAIIVRARLLKCE